MQSGEWSTGDKVGAVAIVTVLGLAALYTANRATVNDKIADTYHKIHHEDPIASTIPTLRTAVGTLPITAPPTTEKAPQTGCTPIGNIPQATKIGALIMPIAASTTDFAKTEKILTDNHVSNVAFSGNMTATVTYGIDPNGKKLTLTLDKATGQLKANAQQVSGVPTDLASDVEGGNINRFNDLGFRFDSAEKMGAAANMAAITANYKKAGGGMAQFGFTIDFAPDTDVDSNGGFMGKDHRTFGSDVSTVMSAAGAGMEGLHQAGVKGTYKHWLNLGAAQTNTDKGPSDTLSLAELRKPTNPNATDPASTAIISASAALIKAHPADFVMMNNGTTFANNRDPKTDTLANPQLPEDQKVPAGWDNSMPDSLNPGAYTLARTEMGVPDDTPIMTDALGGGAIKAALKINDTNALEKEAARRAIAAGADMVIVDIGTTADVAAGIATVDQARIDQAATRVLGRKGMSICK